MIFYNKIKELEDMKKIVEFQFNKYKAQQRQIT